jgi:hypothetical protein
MGTSIIKDMSLGKNGAGREVLILRLRPYLATPSTHSHA